MNKNYYFNPWEIDLLNYISKSNNSIDIIVPFIKINIIKKIITRLYDKPEVSITICSRFDKNVFLQKSSDLPVFELFLKHPNFNNRVKLFSYNKLHAKVYIIDKKIMFISSSNLSYSGLNSNYEIAVKIENQEEIKAITYKFKEDALFNNRLKLTDIDSMKEILSFEIKKSIKTINLQPIQQESSMFTEENSIFVNNYEEIVTVDSSIIQQNKILDEINQIANQSLDSGYYKVNEYEFESVKRQLYHRENTTDEENTQIENIWKEKSQKDLKQIRTYMQSIFESYGFDENKLDQFSFIFIDNSWKNLFSKENFNELNNYYSVIGNQFFNFYVRLSIIKNRYFEEEGTKYYDDLFVYIDSNYPYKEILVKTGLNFYLYIGDLKATNDKDLLLKIIGFLLLNLTYPTFLNFFTQFLNSIDDYVYDDYFIFDFKNKLINSTNGGFRQYKRLDRYYLNEKRIGILNSLSNILEIKNLQLLDIALTHSSVINEEKNRRSYKKLAYVGSYLEQLLLSLICFPLVKDYSSNEELKKFTHFRQKLQTIHEQYFDNLEIKNYISRVSTVQLNQTIKTDVIQALICIKYIEDDFDSVVSFVKNIWKDDISNYTKLNYVDLASPKTMLYGTIQSFYKKDISGIIKFNVLSERREPGNRILHTVQCNINNVAYGVGQGYNKKEAENDAAKRTLESDNFKNNFLIE